MNLQGKINVIKEAKDNIKDAIIAKGVTPSGNISTYASAIAQIDTTNNQAKTTTQNGVIRFDEGYTGLSQVTVNVNQAVQNKTITVNGTYTPDSGYIGFGEINVNVPFVTEEITVNPSTETQIIETEVDGIEKVTVNPVTYTIDGNIIANNIRSGVEILGVQGNIIELKGQTKTVSVTNSGTMTITPDATYNGITSVSITPNLQSKTTTTNGIITPDSGYCGLSQVEVDVDLNLQSKTFTSNGTYTPDSGYSGFDSITVNVNLNLQDKTITTNGTYNADSGYNGFDNVTVNVQPPLQNKTVTTNGSYTADSGYYGLGTVTVNTQSVNNTTLSATQNGTYTPSGNYTGYSSVTVNVPQSTITGSGIPRVVDNGVYKMPTTSFTYVLPNDVTDLDKNALYFAFRGCTTVTSADLSSLTVLNGAAAMSNAFDNCTGLVSVNLSSLETITSNSMSDTFNGCTALTSFDLSALTTLSGSSNMSNAFAGCVSLTSINLPSLTTITGTAALAGAFSGNRNTTNYVTSITFPSLVTLTARTALQYCFRYRTALRTLSFPSLTSTSFGSYTNQFSNMLSEVTGCTVHFPSNLQSVIGSWTDVTNGFGGTNTTVLFDLPATT